MSEAFAATSRLTLPSEPEFVEFARNFARRLRPGDVVALSGPLGCGKTTFVRAAVAQMHGSDQGSSPTFTFWHRYPGEPPIDHLDLFRVENPAEIAELGLEEAFSGATVVFVEWWEHAPELVPASRYEIAIEGSGSAPREIRVREPG